MKRDRFAGFMAPRYQPPARSPLTMRGIAAGLGRARATAQEELRHRLQERYGAARAVLCGSGTQALTLALAGSVPRGRSPFVALPAYACFDLVSAAVGADARLVFYDVDPRTLSPDLDSLARACALRPDAVVVAPLYGIPVDWAVVEEVARPSGALLVEDAAQGIGATWGGRPLGSLGDVSVLSFGRGKGWTGGSGGALLERRPRNEAPEPVAGTRPAAGLAARIAAQWLLGRPGVYWIPAGLPWLALGETRYHPPVAPAGMEALAAALVLSHEEVAWEEAEVRRNTARELLGRLEDGALLDRVAAPGPPSGSVAGYLRFPLLAPGGIEGFGAGGDVRPLGVMPGYPIPLPALPQASGRVVEASDTPGAERLVRDLFTLPTHALLTRSDKDRLLHALGRFAFPG